MTFLEVKACKHGDSACWDFRCTSASRVTFFFCKPSRSLGLVAHGENFIFCLFYISYSKVFLFSTQTAIYLSTRSKVRGAHTKIAGLGHKTNSEIGFFQVEKFSYFRL